MTVDVFKLIEDLKSRNIYFDITSHGYDYMLLTASVPDEIWEIECSLNGEVEIEIYKSDGKIYDEKKLKELFDRYSAP